MSNENQKKQKKNFQWGVKEVLHLHPDLVLDLQHIINLFMESEEADDQYIRIKAMACLATAQELHKVVFENE